MRHRMLVHEVHYGRVVRCFADRPATLDDTLRRAVARAPGAEAIVDGEQRLTYRTLADRVDALADALVELRIAPGERVAILLGNRLDYSVILYACARLGAIAVPLNLRQSADETRYALQDSGASILFHAPDARLPEEMPGVRLRFAVADDAPLPAPRHAGAANAFPRPAEDDAFCILYTSGTTGRPKGAVLTHFNLIHTLLHFEHHYALRDGERVMLAVPASHVTGLAAIIAVTVHLAGCLIVMREFKTDAFLKLAAAERMSYTLMVPSMYVLALMSPAFDAAALASWRVGGFGGAPMPDATIGELAAKLPGLALHNTYGATETTSPAVIMPADQAAARSRQLGPPVACADIVIMDDDGREVPRGESGEIWMGGPMTIPGYWNNPKATEDAFVGGFWRSGDIGSMDADGILSIHDRKKDMLNRGGFKVYSVEVENTLCAHPSVIEAAVIGKPCPVLGERVVAVVHCDILEPVPAGSLRDHCAGLLSDYKVPEEIHLSPDPLPRNANGKLLKRVLRERYVDAA